MHGHLPVVVCLEGSGNIGRISSIISDYIRTDIRSALKGDKGEKAKIFLYSSGYREPGPRCVYTSDTCCI